MSAMIELPKYQCHKQVWALKISAVFENPRGFELHFQDKRYAPHEVSRDWFEKHKPIGGGYFVVYQDGYQSYSPAAAFDEGYTALADLDAVAQSLHPAPSQAALDVLAERRRQVEAGEVTDQAPFQASKWAAELIELAEIGGSVSCTLSDARTCLVKAGALILAELERLDRAAAQKNCSDERQCVNCFSDQGECLDKPAAKDQQ